jgi:hypothetical protein
MKPFLFGKKILFIAPVFYGYEKKIIDELVKIGGEVFFYSERQYNYGYRLFNNFSQILLNIYQKRYYLSILKKIVKIENIDILFVIRGCQMPREFLEKIEKRYPKIEMFMYQWDSEKLNKYIHLKDKFNKIYTFDFDDSRTYNIPYLPLFFTEDIELASKKPKTIQSDYFLLSSYSRERYEFLCKLIKQIDSVRFNHYLYIPYSTYVKEQIKGYRLNKKILKFEPMTREMYIQNLMETRVIIDISSSLQSGLPIRVIEALGAGKKILSTNINILREFGDIPSMKRIIDDFDFKKFANDELDNYVNKCKYSLKEWINKIFIDIQCK